MSSRKKAHAVRRNGRLGIEQAPLLPPIHPTAAQHHTSYAQQQQQELLALRSAFRERLRANTQLNDLEPLLRVATTSTSADSARCANEQRDDSERDDCFASLERYAAQLAPSFPVAAHFLASLVDKIHNFVRERLRAEAAAVTASSHVGCTFVSPNAQQHIVSNKSDATGTDPMDSAAVHDIPHNDSDNSSSSNNNGDDDSSNASSSSDNETPSTNDSTATTATHPRPSPRSNTFRHSLRCRAFPPTRVSASERITTACEYTPFEHSRTSRDATSIYLDDTNRWRVVQFPKYKPSLSRVETDALIQWAMRKLADAAASNSSSRSDDNAAATDAHSRFEQTLALYELICYELTRLVFDKCPTTARFVHGLYVELVDTALRTVANADRDAQISAQRHKNVELELERLGLKLSSVRASLASLEETLRKRQRHLLSERERIIWQRKRLNVLLCADQVLIRTVAGLVQYLLDLSDDLLTAIAGNDPHVACMLHHAIDSNDDGSSSDRVNEPRFALVDDLLELLATKYTSLPDVRDAIAQVKHTRANRNDATDAASAATNSNSNNVVLLSVDKIATGAEDFRSALHRLERLVSIKSPDSIVGWAAQELWDQALFIPPADDVQDLDRDVLRLCAHVEAHVLQQRHARPRRIHCDVAVQTDTSACVTFKPRGRANGFVVIATPFTFDSAAFDGADAKTAAPINTNAHEDVATQHLREEHHDLLERFLPSAFRCYIHAIPPHYVPRQLTLSVVHTVITYLYNAMWQLVRDAFVLQPSSTTRLASAVARYVIPVASIHEYIYRIYVAHFHDPAFATSRLLDLLVSASRLDTQSCKVLLFCRLVGLPGVDPLTHDAFWFMLKTRHVLQRACASAGHYFYTDASRENAFVPQASATEAFYVLFRSASNDVTKRLRLRLNGLASVYGTIWIPASNVIELAMDEWKTAQDVLRMTIHEKIAAVDKCETTNGSQQQLDAPSLASFCAVFHDLNLTVHRLEAAQLYRQLLQQSKQMAHQAGSTTLDISLERFRSLWAERILHAVNQAQHQQHVPSAQTLQQQRHAGSSSGDSSMPPNSSGIYFGAPSEALVAANRHLSSSFLRATWQQTKNDFIRALDAAFHDVGLQVRLIQQMDAIVRRASEDDSSSSNGDSDDATAAQSGWTSLQQLIQITVTGRMDDTH